MTETKSKIMTWVVEDGFTIKDLTTEKDDFRIQIDKPSQSLVVVQKKGKKFIAIYSILVFDQKSLEELSKKDTDELKTIFLDLRLDLARFSTGFQVTWENPKKFLINRINFISNRLFVEDLSRTVFFQFISDLRHCLLYAMWFYQKSVGKFEQNTPEPDKTYI